MHLPLKENMNLNGRRKEVSLAKMFFLSLSGQLDKLNLIKVKSSFFTLDLTSKSFFINFA